MSSASQNVQQAVDWGTCPAPVGSEGHYFTNGTIFILFSHRKTPKFARFTTERFIVHLRDGFPVLWKTWNVFILLFNTTRRMFLIPGVNWRDAQPKICVSTTRKKKKKKVDCPRDLHEAGEPSWSVCDRCATEPEVKFFRGFFYGWM